ncbi:guanine nucleotide exchange factor DBS isoform X1 [Poecilia formosa]|uniref:guanine nucleotide exchange factor DBS isoform X1 n=1 Tax=Poecilia formosa TaxID=48698 RepID=UPI0007BABCEC|nr:PREDICTED: guanine nucleotide exchange factor DBS-like isoform X1 [Poecilia formosa]
MMLQTLKTVIRLCSSLNPANLLANLQGNLSELGKLLMQGSFNVWTDHKKGHSKVKDLARFKPMQRHLFLYDKMLLFCKKREESAEGHEKTPSYSFKHSLKMSSVGITENVKGDNKKFEVWYNGREEVYIIQAPSMDVKNMWVSEIRKVLTGQLEACREASQSNNYGVPMRNVRKMGLRKSDSSNPESVFRRANPSPNMRQKKADASVPSAVNAQKHFTLQGLSNRRSLPAEPTIKEAEATRRFSLTSSLASSSSAMRRTKGPLSASIKSKRHEIKSDPTPFGYEDTLCGAMAAGRKRQSMTSSIAGGSGGKAAVPRSTSQPGWTQRRLLSMDTEDFETIPSSGEESSNSSEDEANNKNGGSSRYRVQLTYASCEAKDLQFLEEGENGN